MPTPTTSGRRRPAMARDMAMRLAATEYDRFVAQLRDLSPDDWARPTACPGWDVHAMVAHVLGMAEFAASVPERLRQSAAARKAGGVFIDALTAVQVQKHVARPPADLVVRMAEAAPRAAAGRRRTPAILRRLPIGAQPVDGKAQLEPWTLGYLTDVILTRDTWMHRSDIATATGRQMTMTAEHDGALVADVAAEWAARHARAVALTLTGPAGGAWTFPGDAGGADPALIEIDAVVFCRILSGRGTGAGLLATRVPF